MVGGSSVGMNSFRLPGRYSRGSSMAGRWKVGASCSGPAVGGRSVVTDQGKATPDSRFKSRWMLRFVVLYPAVSSFVMRVATSTFLGARGMARRSSHWRNRVSDIGAFRFIRKEYELTAT